ncbi:hypothetical protein CEB3_c13630 [Peptococcaceae bacterium CEB3]|nr:hypothetical protein CEB3_c13630 [Peptococcaceae bacterium CEB3]
MERKIFFVDICNTLADVNGQLNLQGYQTNMYPAAIPADVFTAGLFRQAEPIWQVVNLVKRLSERYSIVYLTARRESVRQVTLEWLKGYSLPAGPVIHTGSRLKGELVRELANLDWIAGAIEDSPQEIARYAEAIPGIRLLVPEWPHNEGVAMGMRIPTTKEDTVNEKVV